MGVSQTGIRQRHGRGCKAQGRCKCPWEAAVYSKRDQKKIRKTFSSRSEAAAWRNDASRAVRRHELRASTGLTLDEAATAWLKGAREGVVRSRSKEPFKPSAIRAYEAALRLRILPEFGRMKLNALSQEDLQAFVNELDAKGMSASQIGVTFLPLRAIFKRHRSEIPVNPTAGLEMPAVRGGRDRVAPPHECVQLLDALNVSDRPIWATAIYGGLRRGELMALRIEDVDLANGRLHVRRSWDLVEGEITPKSAKGDRVVPIAAVLRDYLDERLLSLDWSEGLVFGAMAVSPFAPTPLRMRANAAWRRAGLRRISLHECRHTFASLMIAAGVNAKALSTYMGHANISITLDRYGHLMPGNEDEAAALLDAFLMRASEAEACANLAPVAS